MKIKSIIACGLLLLTVGAATTSCEDMFTADNKLVTTDLAPKDTLYQVMGIVKRMQKLADKTVLLGEIRADLVTVNDDVASVDIQHLHENKVRSDNAYNKPADYYAVINNCNIYLAHVDSLLKSHGEYYYEKEICAVKCFRAWCYLELAKIYGAVPVPDNFTKPVLTANAAETIVRSGTKRDMLDIINFCIGDLRAYANMDKNNALRPDYGALWNGMNYANMFIPVRVLLGELYLWRGSYTGEESDFENAVCMYHDFFCFPNEERSVVSQTRRENQVSTDVLASGVALWGNRSHIGNPATGTGQGYASTRFALGSDQIGVIPCDTSSYYGTTSDLRTVFCSQYANNYYPWVSPSQRLRAISTSQTYWYYLYQNSTEISLAFSDNPNDYDSPEYVGDLRLPIVHMTHSNAARSKENAKLNDEMSFIRKWSEGTSLLSDDRKQPFVPYYRIPILYLHMAEALNRAGYPETAFAVLKYGLTYEVMNDRDIISQGEFDGLCKLKSSGFSRTEPLYTDKEMADKTESSFVIWHSERFSNPAIGENQTSSNGSWLMFPSNAQTGAKMQIGIHSLGCGTSDVNTAYELDDAETKAGFRTDYMTVGKEPAPLAEGATPEEIELWNNAKSEYDGAIKHNEEVDADNEAYRQTLLPKRQAYVAQLILDEEALEGMFEGYRFYDLMRYQMQEGKFGSSIVLPEYLKKYEADEDYMTGKPWFLTLPAR